MRSALVIVVPEAEPLVGGLRFQFDPMASRGVPAHVTVLHPFDPRPTSDVLRAVGEVVAGTASFILTFASVGVFPDGVVYLEPEPAVAVRDLIGRLVERFPEYPPYAGRFTDPIPHLTVGSGLDEATARRLADELAGLPAFTSVVGRLTLLVEDDTGEWTVDRHWPLGDAPATLPAPTS